MLIEALACDCERRPRDGLSTFVDDPAEDPGIGKVDRDGGVTGAVRANVRPSTRPEQRLAAFDVHDP
ncbi:MAG: hypothetical protein ACLGI9_11660, partial [Thermoanaerobaculia bacterium]